MVFSAPGRSPSAWRLSWQKPVITPFCGLLPGARTRKLAAREPLTATGAVEFSGPVVVAHDGREAVADVDAVIVALPANGHRVAFDAAVPHLKSGQPVIVSSHSSFGALYLSKRLAERGVSLPSSSGARPF